MKQRASLLSMVLVLAAGLGVSVCPGAPSDQTTAPPKLAEKRERAMDRVVHIEEGILREIPAVPRLCDSMNARKDKVDIGDCKLYCEQEGQGTPLVLLPAGPGPHITIFTPGSRRPRRTSPASSTTTSGAAACPTINRVRATLWIRQRTTWTACAERWGSSNGSCWAIPTAACWPSAMS